MLAGLALSGCRVTAVSASRRSLHAVNAFGGQSTLNATVQFVRVTTSGFIWQELQHWRRDPMVTFREAGEFG
jgi:hypothetical protein